MPADRFEARLQRALDAAAEVPGRALERFWELWKDDGALPVLSLADFRARCAAGDGALALLDTTLGALHGLGSEAAQMRAADRELVHALALAAAARYLHTDPAALRRDGDQAALFRIRAIDRRTAHLLAALGLGAGIRVAPHPQSGRGVAVNVIDDTEALAYGQDDAAFQAIVAELFEWAGEVMGQRAVERTIRHDRLQATGPIDPSALKLRLDRVDRALHLRPLIAIPPGGASALALDATLRARIEQFGVHVFAHDVVPAPGEIENTLRRYIDDILDRLQYSAGASAGPGGASATQAPAGPPSVFIGYAHVDGTPWMERIARKLQALDGDLQLEIWDDRLIRTGDDWEARIEQAVRRSRCAVLVLTDGFFASGFIRQRELPLLRARAAHGHTWLLPVHARRAPLESHAWLAPVHVACADTPLHDLPEVQAEQALNDLGLRVDALCRSDATPAARTQHR